jgi:type IV pilus assembly protein PilN
MIRINLLPHRERRRKQQQQNFFIALGVIAAFGVAVWFVVHTYLNRQFEEQQERNKFLTEEISKLDKQIAEISKVKEQTAALLARAKVVETLQVTRSEVVLLMDQLVRQLPDGVYLKAVKQNGQKVTISGLTQSQARVSTLMRNLDSSPNLENPALIEIKAIQQGNQRMNEFTMNIDITRARTEEGSRKPGVKPAPKG